VSEEVVVQAHDSLPVEDVQILVRVGKFSVLSRFVCKIFHLLLSLNYHFIFTYVTINLSMYVCIPRRDSIWWPLISHLLSQR
jgi:hypothetical protein